MGQRHSSVNGANSGRCTVCFQPLSEIRSGKEKAAKRQSQISLVCGRCSKSLKHVGIGMGESNPETSVAPPPYEIHLHGLRNQRPRTASGGEKSPLRHHESILVSAPRRPATSSGRPQTSQGLVHSSSLSAQNQGSAPNFSRDSARTVMEKRRQMKKVGSYQDEWDGVSRIGSGRSRGYRPRTAGH